MIQDKFSFVSIKMFPAAKMLLSVGFDLAIFELLSPVLHSSDIEAFLISEIFAAHVHSMTRGYVFTGICLSTGGAHWSQVTGPFLGVRYPKSVL